MKSGAHKVQLTVDLNEIVALQLALKTLSLDENSVLWAPTDPRSLMLPLQRLFDKLKTTWVGGASAPPPPASGTVCAARHQWVAHMTRSELLETLSAAGIEYEIVNTPRGIMETAVLVRPGSLRDYAQEEVVLRLKKLIPFPSSDWGEKGYSFYV